MTELAQPVGEWPELQLGYDPTLTLPVALSQIDRLKAENLLLRAELDKARAERDNAAAQVSNYQRYYSRTGW